MEEAMPGGSLNPESPLAQPITDLYLLVISIGAGVLLLVIIWVLYAVLRYRARNGGEGEPRQVYGNTKLETAWTVAPGLLLFGVLILTGITMGKASPAVPAGQQPDLRIIAHQWWWEVHYPQSGAVTANEIHIPAGVRLLIELGSADVIHDFWVPELGRKMDAIPGHLNYLWLEAAQPGEYHGTCAEFCGMQHGWMRILVIAQSQADFDAWQQAQLQSPDIPAGSLAEQGAQLFQELPCVNCHAMTNAGPDLTHLGGRQTLGTGILDNNPENLTKWLTNPQAVKPGVHMPNLKLSPDQIKALVAYLEASK
jgi:cytochrome c oxidase subunit 2